MIEITPVSAILSDEDCDVMIYVVKSDDEDCEVLIYVVNCLMMKNVMY